MAIPLAYNLRNLTERKTTTIMTALGIALTVAVLLSVAALAEGLRTSLAATGHPLNLLVMRKGATAELNSLMTRQQFQTIKSKSGIVRGKDGEPLASLELVTVIVLESHDNVDMYITVRGITPAGWEIRDGVRVMEGRRFQPGRREAVVGKGIVKRYPAARLGGKLSFGRGDWDVVGVLDAGMSASNGEVFVDLNQLASDQRRDEALSSVLLRVNDEVALQALRNDLTTDRRFTLDAVTEKGYYESQTSAGAPLVAIGGLASLFMAVGSSFAAMNTMYAAVARRLAEIGTLRVLGFSRSSILASFLIESVLLSLLGGIIGCLLVLPLNNLATGIGSFVTFSEITFNFAVTPVIMAAGITFAPLLGSMGGLFPAASAARKQILTALRSV
jgi:ABC-type lipoprotein release transport system permease subunit